MARLTKEEFLGASDLVEKEVELPSIGGSVKIRSLPAAYSSQASSEALELTTGRRGEQTARVNTVKLEELQVLHALVEPKLGSVQDARTFLTKCGRAARELIAAIDEISGVNKEEIAAAEARFPNRNGSEERDDLADAASVGSGGPAVPSRAGSRTGDASR